MINVSSPKPFNPDGLLVVFASLLASRPLSPFTVKRVLEQQRYLANDKVTLLDMTAALAKLCEKLRPIIEESIARVRGVSLQSAMRLSSPTSAGSSLDQAEVAWNADRAEVAWNGLQDLMRLPRMQRTMWKAAIEGDVELVSSIEPQLAKELAALEGAQRLLALENPKLNLSALDEIRTRLIQSIPKPPHRPPTARRLHLLRTAAVAAALFVKETGVAPNDAWTRVAKRLNGAGLRKHGGAPFTERTIKNFSGKGMYDHDLLKGMRVLAAAPRFAHVPREVVADHAMWLAIQLGSPTDS
jgi:hypothetical protein